MTERNRIVTTIVSTVDPDTMIASHLIEIDGADDAPEAFMRAVAQSAGRKLIEVTR